MSRLTEPEHRYVRVTTQETLPVFRAVERGGLEPHYDAEIRSLVATGEYTDPGGANWIGKCLIKRRDKIAEAWFSKIVRSAVSGSCTASSCSRIWLRRSRSQRPPTIRCVW